MPLQQLGCEFVELLCPGAVTEVGEDVTQKAVGASRLLGERLAELTCEVHRESACFLPAPELRQGSSFLDAEVREFQRVSHPFQEWPPLLEKLQGLFCVPAIDLDMGQKLVRASRPVRVFGKTKELQSATGIPGRRLGVVLLDVELGLRPVELHSDRRVGGVASDCERTAE
jgi:hypothetical protein